MPVNSIINYFFFYTECDREFLLSVDNNSEGVVLSVLVTSTNNYEHNDITVLHLAGQEPPSDMQCGEGSFRCINPLIIKNNLLNSTTLFVPLRNALLLANFVLNDTGLTLEEYHLINLTRFNCTPVTSFEIIESFYTICLNIEESYLALFEIRLNSESLIRTAIIGPLARNYFNIQNSGLSEFKYIELYHFHFIYFAYASYLYYFDPLNYALDYVGNFHPNCTSVKELVYIGDDTLIGYCSRGAAIYFDLNYQYWTLYQPYSNYGRPFICPNPSKRVVVFSQGGYVQFHASESETIRFELIGEKFVSGECFGDSNGFYFVYVDQLEGTFVLDLATFNFAQLSTRSCRSTSNQPIQVLDNQYLIVQQLMNNHENITDSNSTALTVVLDSQNNFQIITTLSEINRSTSLVSVIARSINSCPSTVPIDRTTTNADAGTTRSIPVEVSTKINRGHENISTTHLPTTSFNSEVIVAIVIGVAGLVLIVLLVAATTLMIIIFIRQIKTVSESNSR